MNGIIALKELPALLRGIRSKFHNVKCSLVKTLSIIYSDLDICNVVGCKKNHEKSYTTRGGEHILSGFSMTTVLSFKDIKNEHYAYLDKNCMKRFFKSIREHAMKIVNFEKKKPTLLTNEHHVSYGKAKFCYICKQKNCT